MKLGSFLEDSFSVSKGAVKLDQKGTIEKYRERYDTLVSNSNKTFQCRTYKVSPKGRILVHTKVPSETVDGFYYDVVLELAQGDRPEYADCDIRVFSNCPAFVYTSAYVFAHWDTEANCVKANGKGLMINELKNKLPRDMMAHDNSKRKARGEEVHDEPVVRNPMGIPLFDNSIYFAVFYMLDNLDFAEVMNNHNNVSMSRIISAVSSFDHLMATRKKLEAEQKRAKKAQQASIEEDFAAQEKNLNKRNRSNMKQPAKTKSTSKASSMRSSRKPSSPKHV